MDALISVHYDIEQYDRAQLILTFVFEARTKLLGSGNANTTKAALKMGLLYSKTGEQKQALEL